MRILLIGGRGMLGRDVAGTAPPGTSVEAPDSSMLDVTRGDSIAAALDAFRPEWVVNCAAYTQVDRAEDEPEAAWRVNAEGPALLGDACGRRGVRVLHFSTDYVFAGRSAVPHAEDAPTDPVNVYGRTKLEGERGLLASGAEALVVRTSWLYGRHGRSFPRTMWARAAAREPTRVVDDQWGRPTSTVDLARASWALIAAGARGVVHATNAGAPTTWFGIAREIFTAAGVPDLVAPCSTAGFATRAARPANSVLDTGRLDALTGGLPAWPESLRTFLDELAAE